jgi:hypothetical protein
LDGAIGKVSSRDGTSPSPLRSVMKCQLSVQKMLACRALLEHDLCSLRQVESHNLLHAIASSKADSEDI